MNGGDTRIVLIEAEDRRRHVLALARASATAELVADWAERSCAIPAWRPGSAVPDREEIHLPSLRDFVGPR
ncbi:MAG: hypothetical protein AAGA17_05885 [Actinomycetota bacterium]